MGANVETVIMDMSYSFRAAVEEALDKPVIVADRFHFVRCVNKSMEKVRIRVQEERNDYDRNKVKSNSCEKVKYRCKYHWSLSKSL